MIFDSTEMRALRDKWSGSLGYLAPRITAIDRLDAYAGERELIEQVVQRVDGPKRNQWIGDLLSGVESQFLGAWFEILLCDWLGNIGLVEVKPDIEGDMPDFAVTAECTRLAVEARAILVKQPRRDRRSCRLELLNRLRQIELPFILRVTELEAPNPHRSAELVAAVEKWLMTSPDVEFKFQDQEGNRLCLSATRLPNLKRLVTAGPTSVERPSLRVVRKALKKKARQHKSLRRKGHPYVVALLLEPMLLTAEEVVEAWLGKQQIVIDVDSGHVVAHGVDRSGLHFFGHSILHTTVSGTMAFKAKYNSLLKRHELRAWYIENPYAAVPIHPMLLPAESRFIVVERRATEVSMRWQPEDIT